jgi:hypothetical protein
MIGTSGVMAGLLICLFLTVAAFLISILAQLGEEKAHKRGLEIMSGVAWALGQKKTDDEMSQKLETLEKTVQELRAKLDDIGDKE